MTVARKRELARVKAQPLKAIRQGQFIMEGNKQSHGREAASLQKRMGASEKGDTFQSVLG